MKSIENEIKMIISSCLNVTTESVSYDSSNKNTENWDSLRHIQIVLRLEGFFKIKYPTELIPELLSVERIIEETMLLVKGK